MNKGAGKDRRLLLGLLGRAAGKGCYMTGKVESSRLQVGGERLAGAGRWESSPTTLLTDTHDHASCHPLPTPHLPLASPPLPSHTGPAANLLMGVVPTAYMRGSRETFFPGEMNFPRFTATLGERVGGHEP